MKDMDVSRLALLFAFAFIGLIFVVVAGLFVESFLQTEKAAEWASAFGGFLAVAAASIIAIAQARQNRRNIDAQIAAQDRALAHQANLQSAALAHQAALADAAVQRERVGAVGAMKISYELMMDIVACLDDDDPSEAFISIWTPNAELSLKLSQSVQMSHLASEGEVRAVGIACQLLEDCWRGLCSASKAKTEISRNFDRFIVKSKINNARYWVSRLDDKWVPKDDGEVNINENEQRAYDKFINQPVKSN